MGTNKAFTILLILILAVSSPMMAKPASASVPKPSVPEFTVKFVDNSYGVPTTYSTDPYTGKNVTHPTYRVINKTIEVMIKNQPFVPYYDANSNSTISLYYNIRMKGHFESNWTNIYPIDDTPPMSNSEYTTFSYPLVEFSNAPAAYDFPFIGSKSFPDGAQVDFQVEAMIGYFQPVVYPDGRTSRWVFNFIGEESGWSNTRTITMPDSSASVSPSPTVPEFPPLVILPLFMLMLSVALILKLRKQPQAKEAGG